MKFFGLVAAAACASAHVSITYPGSRGFNLITNDTYPQGMQFLYPCGGLNVTTNRTYWPIDGGAVAFEPGWQAGHKEGRAFINLGVGDDGPDGGPKNTSFRMSQEIDFTGPSNEQYEGAICLPKLPLPEGLDLKVGDNATIQVVEQTQHGASLYACVDIEFVESDDERIEEVTKDNCFNSTNIEVHDQDENDDDDDDSDNNNDDDDSDNDNDSDEASDNSGDGNAASRGQIAVNLSTVLVGMLASWVVLG